MANKPALKTENISKVLFHIIMANLKNFKILKSQENFVRGNPWFMKFDKKINGAKDTLDGFLHSNFEHESNKSFMVANCGINLLSWKSDSKLYYVNIVFQIPVAFPAKQHFRAKAPFISWNQLMDPENGFVMDDKCSIEIKIKATPLIDVTSGNWVKMEPIDSCDNCSQQKCLLEINKFNQFFGIGQTWLKTEKLSLM